MTSSDSTSPYDNVPPPPPGPNPTPPEELEIPRAGDGQRVPAKKVAEAVASAKPDNVPQGVKSMQPGGSHSPDATATPSVCPYDEYCRAYYDYYQQYGLQVQGAPQEKVDMHPQQSPAPPWAQVHAPAPFPNQPQVHPQAPPQGFGVQVQIPDPTAGLTQYGNQVLQQAMVGRPKWYQHAFFKGTLGILVLMVLVYFVFPWIDKNWLNADEANKTEISTTESSSPASSPSSSSTGMTLEEYRTNLVRLEYLIRISNESVETFADRDSAARSLLRGTTYLQHADRADEALDRAHEMVRAMLVETSEDD